jgi:hypothetical protein
MRSSVGTLVSVYRLRSNFLLHVQSKSTRIWLMFTFFVTVMQFMPQLNSSDLLRKSQYQPEKCLLYETLQDTGILTGVRVTADREVNRDVNE